LDWNFLNKNHCRRLPHVATDNYNVATETFLKMTFYEGRSYVFSKFYQYLTKVKPQMWRQEDFR